MAASLKTSTFTMIKICASILILAVTAALYLKHKLDLFFDNCRPVEEEEGILLTWLAFALRALAHWTWSAKKDHYGQHHHYADQSMSGDPTSSLSCQSSLVQTLTHIVVVDVWNDAKALWTWSTDTLISMHLMLVYCLRTSFLAALEAFCMCVEILRHYSDSFCDWFGLSRQNILEIYKTSAPSMDYLGVIGLVIFILSSFSLSLVCCWKNKRRRKHETMTYKENYFDMNVDKKFAVYTPQTKYYQHTVMPSSDPDGKHSRWSSDFKSNGLLLHEVDRCARADHGTYRDDHSKRNQHTPVKFLVYIMLALLCASIPWEFCWLYQMAISSKAAVASAGAPVECSAMESLTLLQTLKVWLSQQLAWSHDSACDRYYNAMFVDPLWEVTPLMVLMSVVTRCIVHPAELLSAGIGRALRQLLTHIPLHWQPVILLLTLTFALLALLTTCRYRLHVPLLFRIEPRTPISLATQGTHAGGSRGRQTPEGRRKTSVGECCPECRRSQRTDSGPHVLHAEAVGRWREEDALDHPARSRSLSRPRPTLQLTFHRSLSSSLASSSGSASARHCSPSLRDSSSRGAGASRGKNKENVVGTPRGRPAGRVRTKPGGVAVTEKTVERGVGVGSRAPLRAMDVTSNADVSSESDATLTSESDGSPEWTPAGAARGKRGPDKVQAKRKGKKALGGKTGK